MEEKRDPVSARPIQKGDEAQQLSKDSADSAAAKKRVERKRAKSGIKTVTEVLPSLK